MTNAEKGKRHFSLIDSWLNISISSKTLIVQIVLLVIPLAVCIIMFSSVMYLNLAQQSAQKSYQYCRYVVDTFETDMLRIKAISNVIASSQQTTVFLTLADETKADEYYDKAKALITGASANHSKVRNTVLYATEYASPAEISATVAPSFCACFTLEFINTVQREPRSIGFSANNATFAKSLTS